MQASESKQAEFMQQLRKAARLDAVTYCPKHAVAVVTLSLWALHCWDCKRYAANGGDCNPV